MPSKPPTATRTGLAEKSLSNFADGGLCPPFFQFSFGQINTRVSRGAVASVVSNNPYQPMKTIRIVHSAQIKERRTL